MNELRKEHKKIEYKHFVEYRGKEYIREEILMPQSFRYQSTPLNKFEDLHTISWRALDEEVYQNKGSIHYYSHDLGWSKNDVMDKSNPVPKIEKVFKETIGKNLIYI